MESGSLAAMLGGTAEDSQAALARLERTMMSLVREIHVDVGTFKRTVERRLEEACAASGPLQDLVAQLQDENRDIRNRLDELTQQVEAMPVLRLEQKVPKMNGAAPQPPPQQPEPQPEPVAQLQSSATMHSSTLSFSSSSQQHMEESHQSLATHSEAMRSSVVLSPRSMSTTMELELPYQQQHQPMLADQQQQSNPPADQSPPGPGPTPGDFTAASDSPPSSLTMPISGSGYGSTTYGHTAGSLHNSVSGSLYNLSTASSVHGSTAGGMYGSAAGSVCHSTTGSLYESNAGSVYESTADLHESVIESHGSTTASRRFSSTSDSVLKSATVSAQESMTGLLSPTSGSGHEALFSKSTPSSGYGSDIIHDSDSGSVATTSYATQLVSNAESRVYAKTNVSNLWLELIQSKPVVHLSCT